MCRKISSDYANALDERSSCQGPFIHDRNAEDIYRLQKAASESGIEVASMDNEDLFGSTLHELTGRQ